MATVHKIPRLNMEEDVFAAEETKVHTLSRQAIAQMLDTAERLDPISSAPPPPLSGIRTVGELDDGTADDSGELSVMPPIPVPMPKLPSIAQNDDDDDYDDMGLEPTRLSERLLLARPALVTEMMETPPVIVCPKTTPPAAPKPLAFAPLHVANDNLHDAAAVDRRARFVMVVSFFAALVPGLAALGYLLAGR